MYAFEPSDEQRMLIDAVERYAENDLRPASREAEEAGVLPAALVEKGWELGVLQASIPEAYGGFGDHSAVTGVLAAEAMAYGDLAGTLAVMVPTAYAIPILLGGTEAQKQSLLPPVIEAEWKPYVAAFVEPEFDFFAGDMRTTAEKSKDGYMLNGTKACVPFADKAQSYLVFAAIDGRTQAFLVPSDAPGLSLSDRELLLGIHALPTYRLKLENVKVEASERLGGADGFDPEPVIASAQVALAAMGIGVSKAALDYAIP
ncbi:MAG: acyl-CoA dehydrogenase family protein, partial [Anaerolineales bacterium]|nr:acyl-CoA dehydrogenase family protein [Anaerolineales bacterium]